MKYKIITMKKILMLFILSFITSCSSDDTNHKQNPLVGRWQFDQVINEFNNGNEETIPPNACDVLSNYLINQSLNITITSFIENNDGNCELESTDGIEYFKIQHISNNDYLLISKEVGNNERQTPIEVDFENEFMKWIEVYESSSNIAKKTSYFKRN
jgi:hypothetical protein